ncbi:MAG: hypothetical protein K5739_00710 [Lachnospiraceae bacterium]|nr:hypothetical protein [Lachnospiraceae bacterium]
MKKNKQCSDCAMDPDTCGCTDADKDENGMCKCFMSKWGYGGGEGGY